MAEFEVKKYSDIVNSILTYLTDNNKELTDFNSGSIIRTLIEAYSLELNSTEYEGLYQQIQNVYNATRVSTATDGDLDEIASIVGVTRKTGVKSAVQTSLIRQTPALSDFTIPSGSLFATELDASGNQLRFETTQDETFKASITDENHSFKNGVYYYKLDERFYSSVSEITGTASASPITFVANTDYELVKDYNSYIVDVSTIVEVETCESVGTWTSSADATTLATDAVNFKQGSNSFKVGKSGTSSLVAYYENTFTAKDLTGRKIKFKLRVDDQPTIDKIKYVKLRVGEDSSNYLEFTKNGSDLSVGWNDVVFNTDDADIVGSPIITNIAYQRLTFETNNTSDTFTNTKVNVDYIIFAEIDTYEGDVIHFLDTGTLPDTDTNVFVDYIPLSKEVVLQAEAIGANYNVAKNKIVFKVSSLSNVTSVNNYVVGTGGEDVEGDDELRSRVTTSASGAGKATVTAIEQGVSTLDFISSTSVRDMPLKTITAESHTYASGTDIYQLDYEVAQNDTTARVVSVSSTLNGAIDDVVTTITLTDASSFLSSGYIQIEDEIISYSGKSVNNLTGCTRGVQGSTAIAHSDTTTTYQWFDNQVDYRFNSDSTIEWLTSNKPNDTDVFYVDYTYRWLGHIEVFVVGPNTFTAAQQTELDDKIVEYKAAGIAYTWTAPTKIQINVTASVSMKTGYSFDNFKSTITSAIRTKLNSYDIGENVYTSQIIDTIMNVEGVDYVDLTLPASNTTIADDEVAIAGTVLISEV